VGGDEFERRLCVESAFMPFPGLRCIPISASLPALPVVIVLPRDTKAKVRHSRRVGDLRLFQLDGFRCRGGRRVAYLRPAGTVSKGAGVPTKSVDLDRNFWIDGRAQRHPSRPRSPLQRTPEFALCRSAMFMPGFLA
jgi:hypothetical protein